MNCGDYGHWCCIYILHYLYNLLIGPIVWSVTLHCAGKACQGQTSSLVDPLIGYEENEHDSNFTDEVGSYPSGVPN
jgi:hypothetical protein